MKIIDSLLQADLSLLQYARTLITPEYAFFVQIAWELAVIYGAIILIGLWLYGVYKNNLIYKEYAFSIFLGVVLVFVLYAIINLGIPPWRPGAMEAVKGIAPLIPHPVDNSFPSWHALFTGAFLFWICRYFLRSWLLLSFVIIGLITLSARIIGGVHYLGDIIGWLVIGMFWVWILHSTINKIVAYVLPTLFKIAAWFRL